MSEAVTGREITIRRILDAPRRLVWESWTRPEQLAVWWGRRGWSARPSSIVMDVRPGGAFRLTSVRDQDGAEMHHDAVYREVVEPELLVFSEAPRDDCHEGATGSVTLTDLGDGRAEMVFRTTIYVAGEYGGAAEAGLASAFDRLAEHLT